MGYTTEFEGELTFSRPHTDDEVKTINEYVKERKVFDCWVGSRVSLMHFPVQGESTPSV